MNEEYIIKALDDAIFKCGGLYSNLNKMLSDVVDNDDEYKILKKNILSFYKDYRKKNKEFLTTIDNDGNVLTVGGDYEGSVDWDDDVISKGEQEGILLSIHNHPNSTTLPSSADFNRLCQTNCKYSITVSSDGVLIVKNTNPIEVFDREHVLNNDLYTDTQLAYTGFMYNVLDNFENDYNDKIMDLKSKYHYDDIDLFENDDKLKEGYFKDKDALLTNYISGNIDGVLGNLQERLDDKVGGFDLIHISNKTN